MKSPDEVSESPVDFIISLNKISKRLRTDEYAQSPDIVKVFGIKVRHTLQDEDLGSILEIPAAHFDTRQKKSGIRIENKARAYRINKKDGMLAHRV
ncbi:hypothetical protein IMZ48_18265 [Candidatus Bathyarchaeota archaeon]|nr:hypothetical protein [Candidatus Bathyarchaeota archaeon]